MDCTDEIINEYLTIIEDACLLISGENLNPWGLTLTDRMQNISHETEILSEQLYSIFILSFTVSNVLEYLDERILLAFTSYTIIYDPPFDDRWDCAQK